jgi:hypothetical protein
MAVFDLKAAARVASTGGDFPTAVGTAFGVPQCMLGLAQDVLSVLPGSVLGGVAQDLLSGRDAADSVMQSINNFLRETLGIIQWDTENGGFIFISASSKNGYDRFGGNFLSDALGFLNAATAFAGSLYQNYQTTVNQINGIRDCFKTYTDYLKYKNGNSGNALAGLTDEEYNTYINDLYAVEISQMQQARDFIVSADAQLEIINDILAARAQNPELEPVFNCEAIQYLSGTRFEAQCLQAPPNQEEVFRLIYSPPKSTFGQFILSNDGIYFNSQLSGILPAINYVENKKLDISIGDKWKLDQDPNAGGRGKGFTSENLKLYVNTILDPNIIDDTDYLQVYYKKDGFLQELINNKNKRLYDLSAQISELEGASAPEAVIFNYRQSLISENTNHIKVINKRKKQIELAVKLPQKFSSTSSITYAPGSIPVNDFSYLAGMNIGIDIQRQKSLLFSQVDIDGVVSPIQLPLPTLSKVNSKNSSTEHLLITDQGDAAIIYDGSSVSAVDSAVILPAEHFISTDSCIAIYNFLDANVEVPSSTAFTCRNNLSKTDEDYSQLVAGDSTSVFGKGLGIPYFEGVTKHSSTAPNSISGVGSFLRLPNTKKLNDLLYNKEGATIDFWIHAPSVSSVAGYDKNGVSSLFRLVLANENTGSEANSTTNSKTNNLGTQTVRGFIMGFSRDDRITKESAPTNNALDNQVSSSVFFIAPTQSTSISSVDFIRSAFYDSDDCYSGYKNLSMIQRINESSSEKYFSSCGREFCHVAVTLDPRKDEIKFYLDSVLTTTSSLSQVFGIEKYRMPNIPTFKKNNSFKYSSSNLNSDAPEDIKAGPGLDPYFTPWIVGGGYTDGMFNYGNFMGTQYGGIKSGLNGYLGSLKLYSKALDPSEIVNNYNAHKGFFKNIDISNL